MISVVYEKQQIEKIIEGSSPSKIMKKKIRLSLINGFTYYS